MPSSSKKGRRQSDDNPHSEVPRPFVFSQSSLQDYADCPRRFMLRYIVQMNWPAVESEPVVEHERRQQEGQVLHRLVQQHLLGLPQQKLDRLANTPDVERWWNHYLAAPDLQDLRNRGGLNPELTLSCPIGDHRLLAKYDLVAIQNGKAIIYDWKTSARRPRDEWLAARWQTRVYRALLVQAGTHLNNGRPFDPEQIEMNYWFADFPSEPALFKYDAVQFKRDWSAIETLVQELSSTKDFPLTEDEKKCNFCVYRSYCNRGRQAGDLDDAEAEVQADAAFDVNFEQIGEIEF